MPDTILPFETLNGLSITGSSVLTIAGATGPDTDEILYATGTTGNTLWGYPAAPVHTSGAAKLLIPVNASAVSVTVTTGVTGQVSYFPFVIHSTITTKAALWSAGLVPSITGTAYAKIYAANRTTGLPAASVGDYGTITTTANTSTVFVSSGSVTLNPGMYWLGYTLSTAINNMRRPTTDTAYATKLFGVGTPTGTTTWTVYFTESGLTLPPSTAGSVTEQTSSAVVIPILQVQ